MINLDFMLSIILSVSTFFWFFFIYKKDRFEPEPILFLLKLLIIGGLMSAAMGYLIKHFLVFNLGDLFLDKDNLFLSSVLFYLTGFADEFSKLFVLLLLLRNSPEFDEPVDGIIYAATISLGYVIFDTMIRLTGDTLQLATIRNVFSIPGHLVFALIWGYGLSTIRFKRAAYQSGFLARIVLMLPYILLAALANGTFYSVMTFVTGKISLLVVILFLMSGYYFGIKKIQLLLAHSPYRLPGQCYRCLRSSTNNEAKYCQYCGSDLKPYYNQFATANPLISEPVYCSHCNTRNRADAEYCLECGKPLE